MKAISFESVDRIPMMDFGYWRETIDYWHKQGLPADVDSTEEVEAYFGLDRGFETNLVNYWADNGPVGIMWGIWPEFTKVKVGETEDTIIYEGEIGRIVESKAGSIPAHEKSPVETMADFQRLVVPRMNAWDPTRVTPEFAGMLERGKAQGQAIGTLADVLQPGANDVYEIKTPKGMMYLAALPFVIKHVDAKAGVIVVDETRLPEVAVFED